MSLESTPATMSAAGEWEVRNQIRSNGFRVEEDAPPDADEAEILQASIKAGAVAQIVVAVVAVVGLIYVLKLVLITALTATLLAFVLEPVVSALGRIRIPRSVGALVAVLLMGLWRFRWWRRPKLSVITSIRCAGWEHGLAIKAMASAGVIFAPPFI
jgi:hypothetical protein